MALQSKEKYDPNKVERLSEHLRLYQEKGQPIDYEIVVDGFKVVRRTNDPAMFSMFENFIDANTKSMEILLYNGASNNNDKTIFYFGELPKEGLSGVDIDNRIDEGVQRKLKERDYDTLKKDNEDLEKEVDELEKQVEQLEKEKSELVASQSPLKGVLGEIGSSLVESFIKRNPQVMKSIPGGEALAGLIENDDKNKSSEETSQEAEVSFTSKSALSEDHKYAIQFVDQLKTQFTREEFDKVLLILEGMSNDKSKIEIVLNHIKQV
jgi:hypothetical protein